MPLSPENLSGDLIALAFFGLMIVTLAMHAGAKLAGIRDATMGRSFLASMTACLTTFISLQVAAGVRGPTGALAALAGAALVVNFIRIIYRTTLGKALVTWFVNVLVQMITSGLLLRLTGGAK